MGGESLLMLDWLANPEVPLEIHASGDSAKGIIDGRLQFNLLQYDVDLV